MKKVLLVVLSVVMIGLSACSGITGGASNPDKATWEFYIGVRDGKYAEAKKYLTREAREIYREYDLDKLKTIFSDEDCVTAPDTDSLSITGDIATQRIILIDAEIELSSIDVNLSKIGSRWYISSIKY